MRKFLKIAELWASMGMLAGIIFLFWCFVVLVVHVNGIVWLAVFIAVVYTWFCIDLAIRLCKHRNKE